MANDHKIRISLETQTLELYRDGKIVGSYPVSTGLNGPGESSGSGCTPRGRHKVRLKIGADAPVNSVFAGRRPTGEIYSEALARENPDRDWILTRIIWLTGCEPGINRYGSRDTLRRYIYIHGCPDTEPMGVAKSHGCIRMRNKDLVELFDRIEPGAEVEIVESAHPGHWT